MMDSQLPPGYSAASAPGETVSSGQQQQQPQQLQPPSSGNSPPETSDGTSSNTTLQNSATPPPDSEHGGNSQPQVATTTTKTSRKRTKTGCLTCRKRRIKCGEERPTCSNCIKSKRVCEGYNQRVVFKDGMNGMYRSGMMGAAGGSLGGRLLQPYPIQPAPAPGSGSVLQPIAPAPPVNYRQPEAITPLDQSNPPHFRQVYEERQRMQQRQPVFHGLGQQTPAKPPGDTLGHRDQQQQDQDQYSQHQQVPVTQGHDQGAPHAKFYPQVPNSTTSATFSRLPTSSDRSQLNTPTDSEPAPSIFGPGSSSAAFAVTPFTPYVPSHPSVTSNPNSCSSSSPPIDRKYALASGGGQLDQPAQQFGEMFKNDDNIIPTSPGSPGPSFNPATITPTADPDFNGAHFVNPEFVQLHQAPPDLEHSYDDDDEDGMYDEDDDDDDDYEVRELDEMMLDPTGQEMTSQRAHISNVIEPYSRHLVNSRISFRSFLPDHGVLTTYHPTFSSSPLMNHTTAKIFCHFIYVLGPSLSLFERHPPNPHVVFTPGAGLHGPQNVWSYTVPMLSLSHPPLLHAILALSSLHISKLTRGPTHPSLLHYHIALRRLGKAIASDKHRGHAATLTATLLLGYYETMAAEHDKWSSHIHGAKQLLKEIDFDRLNRRISMMEEDERATGGQGSYNSASQPSLLRLRKMRRQPVVNEVDENLTAYMMGKARRRPHGSGKKPDAPFTRKEEEMMQLQEDMFWWFAKMDCYQSVLSGCPLVLDYIFWSQCPPRARISTLGTTYGSSDHFYLLLGRLCDFQVRDLKRKQAVQKANGGMWIPPPEMGGPPRGMARGRGRGEPGMQGPPMGRGGPSRFPGGPLNGPPGSMGGPSGTGGSPGMGGPLGTGRGRGVGPPLDQMQFGMIPVPVAPPRLPTAFAENLTRNPNEPLATAPSDDLSPEEDLEAATVLAETEWEEIFKAFHVFQESLGHEYQPLGIEYMPVQNTPFGAAIYFRTYSIATLQSLYNMALIILHRCHPSMPAVSMIAAGVAARKTAKLATDTARITAGLVPTDPTGQINPALGASLIESSMPMFFAAVQYQDQAQRDWVVMKLREIARLTGWATASRVLLGCQRAWEKAAEMGRGPAYTRPPFEEEGELFYEAFNARMAADTGIDSTQGEVGSGEAGSERFLWRTAGRRAAAAVGILGEEGEDLGFGGLNLNRDI